MLQAILLSAYLVVQPLDSIPYKAADEYTIKFDLKFKTETTSSNSVNADNAFGTQRAVRNSANLPYITLIFRATKLASNEIRLRIVSGVEPYFSKKISLNDPIKLELGFADDIKDKIVPNEYTIYLLDDKKKPVSRIIILFDEEGYYFVNGQQRGKI